MAGQGRGRARGHQTKVPATLTRQIAASMLQRPRAAGQRSGEPNRPCPSSSGVCGRRARRLVQNQQFCSAKARFLECHAICFCLPVFMFVCGAGGIRA